MRFVTFLIPVMVFVHSVTAWANAAEILNPVLRWPDAVSICFLPLRPMGVRYRAIEDVRCEIVRILNDKEEFDYRFFLPSETDSEQIFADGFAEGTYRRLPRPEYWKNKGIQYLAFGEYRMDGEKVVVEYLFHSLHDDTTILFGKRYAFEINESKILHEKIASEITEALRQKHIGYRPSWEK